MERLSREQEIENWFTYHPPNEIQTQQYAKLRDAAKQFARTIVDCTPMCADQTSALRHLREAVMTANAAIACGGK